MSILLAFKEWVDNNGIGGMKRILLETFKGCVYEDSTRDSGVDPMEIAESYTDCIKEDCTKCGA